MFSNILKKWILKQFVLLSFVMLNCIVYPFTNRGHNSDFIGYVVLGSNIVYTEVIWKITFYKTCVLTQTEFTVGIYFLKLLLQSKIMFSINIIVFHWQIIWQSIWQIWVLCLSCYSCNLLNYVFVFKIKVFKCSLYIAFDSFWLYMYCVAWCKETLNI